MPKEVRNPVNCDELGRVKNLLEVSSKYMISVNIINRLLLSPPRHPCMCDQPKPIFEDPNPGNLACLHFPSLFFVKLLCPCYTEFLLKLSRVVDSLEFLKLPFLHNKITFVNLT
jgi:hypothetical protein